MKQRFNNKILGAVLAVLLILLFISYWTGGKSTTFDPNLLTLNPESITAIEVSPKKYPGQTFAFVKESGEWKVKQGDNLSKVDAETMENILREITRIRAERLAGGREQWTRYSVGDTGSTKEKIYEGGEVKAELYIGRFALRSTSQKQKETPEGLTYLRLAGNEEVYAVRGFIGMDLNQPYEYFDNRILIKINPDLVEQISFTHPDGNFTLRKTGNVWKSGNRPVDSLKINQYLKFLEYRNGGGYTNLAGVSDRAPFQVSISGGGMETVTLYGEAYGHKHFFKSSQNPEKIFYGPGDGLFADYFKTESWFF